MKKERKIDYMKHQTSFRPTAIPLITSDPYFSVWSFSDRLFDDHTRHWTGHRQSMCGVLTIDGEPYRFMGLSRVFDQYQPNGKALEQVSVTVNPTSTVYRFCHAACDLTVTFLSPLLMDRLEFLSRPASYIFYEITPKSEGHHFSIYFDFAAELSGDAVGASYAVGSENGLAWVGRAEQNPLNRSGDDVRIDWGYLHLVHPNATVMPLQYRMRFFKQRIADNAKKNPIKPLQGNSIPCATMPILCVESEALSGKLTVAYDDIKSIQYYGKPIDAYYKKHDGDFQTMLKAAEKEADTLRVACAEFDAKLMADMEKVSPAYAKIGALAYRQAIAAHKLIEVDGQLMFLSKENFSNGCLGTLDVTYPSIPLFLLYNPELVRGMMRPLFAFARTQQWTYDFAPHDCGQYPFCNGQVYGLKDGVLQEHMQMPVEECGNGILTVAIAWHIDGDRSLIEENADLLTKWADYLVAYGYDPDNQLCTDDFAGHLAHNCNLSLKAIVALGACAKMFNEPKYEKVAQDMAARWCRDAKRENLSGYRLTFDQNDSWSMKYNIIWDRLLGLGLFDAAVSREEIAVYREKMNRYGVPLDSRSDYTKLDWMAWTTVMTDDPAYTKAVYEAIARMICESGDRVPITDWYYTSTAAQASFQARSVLGGFYINLLAKRLLEETKHSEI